MDPKWNRSLSNTNELSEEEEITETVQRTRKIIRGAGKTEIAPTVKHDMHHG